jgi:hypothetical protein
VGGNAQAAAEAKAHRPRTGAVAVSEHKPDQACLLAEEALDQLAKTWYATGMDRIRALRQALEPWESRPCVRRLDERLYDWATTVAALTG